MRDEPPSDRRDRSVGPGDEGVTETGPDASARHNATHGGTDEAGTPGSGLPDGLDTLTAPLQPVTHGERIDALDILRGFAICGILLINIQFLSGYQYMGGWGRASLAYGEWNESARWMLRFLVQGKFYSIFSFLFGVGAAIQWERATACGISASKFFSRRMVGLLLIGLVHSNLIWYGDILIMYALIGFLLIPFLGRSNRTVLISSFVVMWTTIPIYGLMMKYQFTNPLFNGSVPGWNFGLAMRTIESGSFIESLHGNYIMNLGRWTQAIIGLRQPRILALFLLGVWAWRAGIFRDIAGHRRLLWITAIFGLTFGLAGNFFLTKLMYQGVYMPPSPLGLVQTILRSTAWPALALGYAAILTLMSQYAFWRTVFRPVANAGRMALTNYIGQSIVGVIIFNGWAFGLFRELPLVVSLVIALAIFVGQMIVSSLWLMVFRQGPAEWLWRKSTYRGFAKKTIAPAAVASQMPPATL